MNTKTYFDEMYEYLTIPENYNSAMDLSENLSMVETKLRDEFWEKVTDQIKSNTGEFMQSKNQIFEFKTKKDDESIHWFQIRKNDWKYYQISTENSDVGIEMIEDVELKVGRLEQSIKEWVEMEEKAVGKYRNPNWLCWDTFNKYTFNSKAEKMSILPSKRPDKIVECANEVSNYIEKIIKVCDLINTKITESKYK